MKKAATVKWIALGDSYYRSACGRFELDPRFIGRQRPQFWMVVDTRGEFPTKRAGSLELAKGTPRSWLNPPRAMEFYTPSSLAPLAGGVQGFPVAICL